MSREPPTEPIVCDACGAEHLTWPVCLASEAYPPISAQHFCGLQCRSVWEKKQRRAANFPTAKAD